MFCLSTALSFGQAPDIEWQTLIGGSSHDLFRKLVLTNDNGFLLAGQSSSNISGDKTENSFNGPDYWVVKLDANRDIQWRRTLGSATFTTEGDGQEYLSSAIQTTDGGFLIGGWSSGGISGNKTEVLRGFFDYWIVKLDAAGNTQWQKAYGGTQADQLYALQQTTDGGYILAGSSSSSISGEKSENSRGMTDGWIIKIDSIGNIEWQKTIGGNAGDFINAVRQTADGGYIIGGYSNSPISGEKTEPSFGGTDYWILKLDSVGNIIWQRTIGGSGFDRLHSIIDASDGGYFMAGDSNSPASGLKTENSRGLDDYWIIKLNATGDIEWQKTYGGSSNEGIGSYSVVECQEGYVIVGDSDSSISGEKAENSNGDYDAWILRLNQTGEILWQKTIGGSLYDGHNNVLATADGRFLLGGVTESSNSGDITETGNGSFDYWIVKLAPEELSVPDYDIAQAVIYPNPTQGGVSIKLPTDVATLNVQVTNILGQTLGHYRFIHVNQVDGIPLGMPDGVYFVTVKDGSGKQKTFKVIKH